MKKLINHTSSLQVKVKPEGEKESMRKHEDHRLTTKLLVMASNTKLNERQAELDKLLYVRTSRNTKLQIITSSNVRKGEEKLTVGLESTKAEVEDFFKDQASVTAAKLKATTCKMVKLEELERRVLKGFSGFFDSPKFPLASSKFICLLLPMSVTKSVDWKLHFILLYYT